MALSAIFLCFLGGCPSLETISEVIPVQQVFELVCVLLDCYAHSAGDRAMLFFFLVDITLEVLKCASSPFASPADASARCKKSPTDRRVAG